MTWKEIMHLIKINHGCRWERLLPWEETGEPKVNIRDYPGDHHTSQI